jgi:hypothetical protein
MLNKFICPFSFHYFVSDFLNKLREQKVNCIDLSFGGVDPIEQGLVEGLLDLFRLQRIRSSPFLRVLVVALMRVEHFVS